MNNIISTKRNSALLLVSLLVLGTISIILPSAQAQPYEMYNGYGSYEPEPKYANNNSYEPRYHSYQKEYSSDNSYYKSKDSVIVKKVKCNNINVNVNGLELDGLPPFLGNLTSDRDTDGYSGAGSYGSGERNYGDGQKGSDGDFKFICINNNNNTFTGVDEGVTPPPIPTPEEECEECFLSLLNTTQIGLLEDALESTTGIPITIPGVGLFVANSLEELCEILSDVTGIQLIGILNATIFPIIDIQIGSIEAAELRDCIAEALGIVILD